MAVLGLGSRTEYSPVREATTSNKDLVVIDGIEASSDTSQMYSTFLINRVRRDKIGEFGRKVQTRIKPAKAAQKYMSEAVLVSPYSGAKEMLLGG